jgi:membrane glycosyltransferase
MYLIEPQLFWWSLPLTLGYLVAMPFAVLTAMPALGRWMKRAGIAGIPEDFNPPAEVRAVMGEKQA